MNTKYNCMKKKKPVTLLPGTDGEPCNFYDKYIMV